MPKGNKPQDPRRFYHRHFQQLATLATDCIIQGIPFFFLCVSAETIFPEGFPKMFVVERTHLKIKYKCHAKSMLNWLYSEGRTRYDAKMLLSEMRSVDMSIKMLIHHSAEVNSNKHKRRGK
jgi:hypothetical protein